MINSDLAREYRRRHKYCPKCGHLQHAQTCVGYFITDENSQDLNKSKCTNTKCNWEGTIHDRVENPVAAELYQFTIQHNLDGILKEYAMTVADEDTLSAMRSDIERFMDAGKNMGFFETYKVEFDPDDFTPIVTVDEKYVFETSLLSQEMKDAIEKEIYKNV